MHIPQTKILYCAFVCVHCAEPACIQSFLYCINNKHEFHILFFKHLIGDYFSMTTVPAVSNPRQI